MNVLKGLILGGLGVMSLGAAASVGAIGSDRASDVPSVTSDQMEMLIAADDKKGNSRSNRRDNTGTSGPTGSKKDVNIGDNNGRHIYGLKWSERSDKPCYIDVFTGGFVGGKFDPVGNKDGESESECEEKGSSMKEINFGKPSGTAPFYAVDGIKVCMNSAKTRMKGITLYAEQIDKGTFTGQTAEKTAERTNCAEWMPKKSCPSKQIASELIFHYKDGAIMGIDLACSEYGWD